MSARNKIVEELVYVVGWGPGDANALMDAYVHELAEKIRADIGPEPLPYETVRVARYVQGHHAAANLIDPEVGK